MSCLSGRSLVVLRKDRVLDALRSLCIQQSSQQNTWLQRIGVSAEEVAELAKIDRTNASRDLNQLVQEGKAERIPGRPVLFVSKAPARPLPEESSKLRAAEQSEVAIQPPEAA